MRAIFFSLLFSLLISLPAIAVEVRCEVLYDYLVHSEARLKEVVEMVGKLRPEVVSGTVTPVWDDFDKLEKLAAKVQEIEASHGGKDGDAIKELIHKTKEKFLEDPALKKFGEDLQAKKVKIDPSAYKPTEHELKRLYQDNLAKLNQHLPQGLRIPTARIPYTNRNAEIKRQAIDLIKKERERFETLFPSSGFKNQADLGAAIRASKDPDAQKLQSVLINDHVEFVMRRPENARFWTPKVGFHNQHVTKTSKGFLDNDVRNAVEAKHLGIDPATYSGFDNDLKPKYGYLGPKANSGLEESSQVAHYGSDKYILKKSSLRDRTTFTPSDSLNGFTGASKPEDLKTWESSFVPWDHRQILVPDLLPEFKKGRLQAPEDDAGNELKIILRTGDPLEKFTRRLATSANYVEMQFWGPVTLDDVEVFEFTSQPPAGDFLKELQSRGIKIRDGRAQPPKAWNP